MLGLLRMLAVWGAQGMGLFAGFKLTEGVGHLFGSADTDAGADPSWESLSAAGSENDAAANLVARTQVLRSLDAKLAALASQITDENDAAKKKLLSTKAAIDRELAYLDSSGDSSVVKAEAVNRFLQDRAADIADVITEAAQKIPAHRDELAAVGGQYPSPYGGVVTAGAYGPSNDPYDYYGGYDDGYRSDPGGGGLADGAASMLPGLASMLPGALGGPLGGLGAPLSSLGDLASAARQDPAPADAKLVDHVEKDNEGDKKSEGGENKGTQAGEKDNDGSGTEGAEEKQGAQPIVNEQAQTPPPAPASTLVTATAGSEQLAAAARAHLGGQDLERAYRDAELFLPPAGTPVKDSLPSASAAQMGDLAVFKDRYVMMGGDNTVYLDGEMQPMSALSKLSGFLGFRRAPQPAGGSTPAVQVSAPSAADSVAQQSTF